MPARSQTTSRVSLARCAAAVILLAACTILTAPARAGLLSGPVATVTVESPVPAPAPPTSSSSTSVSETSSTAQVSTMVEALGTTAVCDTAVWSNVWSATPIWAPTLQVCTVQVVTASH